MSTDDASSNTEIEDQLKLYAMHQLMAETRVAELSQQTDVDEIELLKAQLAACTYQLPAKRHEVFRANQRLLAAMQGNPLAQKNVEAYRFMHKVAADEQTTLLNTISEIRSQIADATNRALTDATLQVARETARSATVTARATVVLAVATIVLILATIAAAFIASA